MKEMKEMKKMKEIKITVPENVNIGDYVYFTDEDEFSTYPFEGVLKAVTSDGRFVDQDGEFWKHVKPVPKKKEKAIKPLKEFVQTLLDEGYLPTGAYGDWHNKDTGRTISNERFDYCGMPVPVGCDFGIWDESWLQDDENENEDEDEPTALKKDDIVEVRDSPDRNWILRRFSHFSTDGSIHCYSDGKSSKNSMSPISWNQWRRVK